MRSARCSTCNADPPSRADQRRHRRRGGRRIWSTRSRARAARGVRQPFRSGGTKTVRAPRAACDWASTRRHSLFDQAAAADQLYLRRYPLDPEALISAQRLHETYRALGPPGAGAPRPGSTWRRCSPRQRVGGGADLGLRAHGRCRVRAHLVAHGGARHPPRRAHLHGSADDWRETLRLYQLLIAHWPRTTRRRRTSWDRAKRAPASGITRPRCVTIGSPRTRGTTAWRPPQLVHRVAVNDLWYEHARHHASWCPGART